jgi:hypothetical protein
MGPLLGDRRAAQTRFGFSWAPAVSLRKPPIMSVGFAWISLILSTESRLFNALQGFLSEEFFLPVFGVAKEPSKWKPRIWHAESTDSS